MLHARAEAADQERDHERDETDAGAGKAIANAADRDRCREHQPRTDAVCEKTRGDLEARHGAGKSPRNMPIAA